MHNGKKIVSIFLLMGVFFAVSVKPVYADAWGAAIASQFVKRQLDNAYDYVQGTLLGSLKVAAYQALSRQISALISGRGGSGSGSGAQFIDNWKTFLYQDAANRAKVVVNDFYVTSLRGMLDTGGYVPAYGGGGSRIPYTQTLKQNADALIFSDPKYTLNEYCSDPSMMFDTKDLRCFNAFFANQMNNPHGYALRAQQVYIAEMMRAQDIARTQAIAYKGYRGTVDKYGNTVTPGSTVAAMQEAMNSHLLGMPLSAKHPSEIAAMTASTFVNSLLQQAVREGMIRVDSEVRNKVNEGITAVAKQLGPVAEFIPLQQIGSDITRSTLNTGYKWALGTGATTPTTGSATVPIVPLTDYSARQYSTNPNAP
jgi:hypothetical protein